MGRNPVMENSVRVLEYQMMDIAPNTSNPKCYTPSSEPIRI
jgi:hypothetical protein